MTLIGVLLLVLTPSFGLYQPSLLIRERELAVGARITTSLDEGVRIKGRYRTRRGEGRGGVHMTSFEKSTSSGDSCFFFWRIRWNYLYLYMWYMWWLLCCKSCSKQEGPKARSSIGVVTFVVEVVWFLDVASFGKSSIFFATLVLLEFGMACYVYL